MANQITMLLRHLEAMLDCAYNIEQVVQMDLDRVEDDLEMIISLLQEKLVVSYDLQD